MIFGPYIIFTINVYTGFQKNYFINSEINSGVRSNFKQFELQYLLSTATEIHAVKNWHQWKVATKTSQPAPINKHSMALNSIAYH